MVGIHTSQWRQSACNYALPLIPRAVREHLHPTTCESALLRPKGEIAEQHEARLTRIQLIPTHYLSI